MAHWSRPNQLVKLEKFYQRAKANPEATTDVEFMENITQAFWPSNCWNFVEAAFAIIAPGCAMRPHLVEQLIRQPIAAMIAGGLENPEDIIACGLACATKQDAYVEPSIDGKRWLVQEWPNFAPVATAVFLEKWQQL